MFKCFFHCYCRWCQRFGRHYLVQTPEEHSSTDVPNFLTTNFVSFIQIFLSYPKTIWPPTDKKNVCKLLSGWTFLWIYLEGVIFVLFCFVLFCFFVLCVFFVSMCWLSMLVLFCFALICFFLFSRLCFGQNCFEGQRGESRKGFSMSCN